MIEMRSISDAKFLGLKRYFNGELCAQGQEFESDKIELVSSPRPVDRDHLKRDFKAALDDIETSLRYLRYMYGEL